MIFTLQWMVQQSRLEFSQVRPGSHIKEFGVILGPLVALVSAATGFYYATRR